MCEYIHVYLCIVHTHIDGRIYIYVYVRVYAYFSQCVYFVCVIMYVSELFINTYNIYIRTCLYIYISEYVYVCIGRLTLMRDDMDGAC